MNLNNKFLQLRQIKCFHLYFLSDCENYKFYLFGIIRDISTIIRGIRLVLSVLGSKVMQFSRIIIGYKEECMNTKREIYLPSPNMGYVSAYSTSIHINQ